MDTTEVTQNGPPDGRMELDRDSLLSLHEAGGWANFLAIMGFIMIGFVVLVGLFMGTVLSTLTPSETPLPFPSQFFTVFYIMMAAVYFFPVYYLYNFASQVRSGVRMRDMTKVASAFRNLKSHYKFIGILTIVVLSLYFLILLLVMALGAGSLLGGSVNA